MANQPRTKQPRTKQPRTNQPIITAIDLGTSKITVIIAALNSEGNFEIKGIGENESHGIEAGIVKDIRMTSEALKKAIDIAETDSDLKAENIYVSITGKYIKSTNANSRLSIADQMNSESGVITQEHVDKVIKTAVEIVLTQEGDRYRKLIHAIPRSYQVDDQPNTPNPVEMSGDILTAHIHVVLADINHIRNIRRCFELIGYRVEQTVFAPLASAKAVLTEDEKNLGCILIDIGAGTTDTVLFFENIIFLSAVKAYGGNNISAEISKIMQTSAKASENLKIFQGDALLLDETSEAAKQQIEVEGIGGRAASRKSKSLLCEVIHAKIVELLEEIYKLVSCDNYHNYIDAGIVLTGGTASLTNIELLTAELFNMPVRTGKPNLKYLTGKTNILDKPEYAAVVGILYYAKEYLDMPEIQVEEENNVKNTLIRISKTIYETIADIFKS